jgi:DNA-binding beta-propeller fold protein YncE
MSPQPQKKIRSYVALCVIAAFGIFLTTAASLAKTKPAFGTITKFASVPPVPGYPEGVAVHGNSVFVSGPARFGTAGTGPSAIHVYNRKTGQLVQTIVVQGEALAFEHALSNIAIDGQGRIYALSTQLGLIRFTKQGQSYQQSAYGAPLPDIPPVSPGPDFPPIPNDVVFDDDGNAYVTDSLQATIFRYGPGGGAPTIWFQSPLFVGSGPIPFGPNGIRLDPEREHVYVVVTTSPTDPNTGTIYRLPLVDSPLAADLETFHVYAAGEGPDQLAFAADGKLYVTLAFTNQISILSTSGAEITRISSQVGDEVPLDNPAGIAFDSRTKSVLVANHALLSGNPAHFAVLSVYVGETGDPLSQP